MFRRKELRRFMYCAVTDWTGAIYSTATMTGSRTGGAVAAAWAAMCKMGEDGYVASTKAIVGATKKIAAGIEAIEGVKLVGRADVCVVAFDGEEGSGLNCYAIGDCLKSQFGWDLGTTQRPPSCHLAVTMVSATNADRFLEELRTSIELVKQDTEGTKFASSAGVYGMAASLPPQFVEVGAFAYLDAQMETDFSK